MTDKWAEHKQKFCGCKDASRLNRCQGRNNCELPEGHPERVSAAPRQPEGEGLEVVASQFPEINFSNYGQDEVEALQAWGFTALDAMADAQRAIAELRDECNTLRIVAGSVCGERDTLRQQRDKLAGLLADVKADYTHAIHWEDMHASMKRIDAALAEVNKWI